ncbi:MAG: CBS domain-containing protein, partial [Halarsenatibacteraceae bacterium]
MTKEVITVDPETSVEEAAELMSQYNISGLPV